MKITKSYLKEIIKEELDALSEIEGRDPALFRGHYGSSAEDPGPSRADLAPRKPFVSKHPELNKKLANMAKDLRTQNKNKESALLQSLANSLNSTAPHELNYVLKNLGFNKQQLINSLSSLGLDDQEVAVIKNDIEQKIK